MLIEIIDVSAPAPVKKYFTIEVAYKHEGKVGGKKLMSFLYPEVFKKVQEFKRGDFAEVESVKNDAGYWDWVAISHVDAPEVGNEAVPPARDFKKEVTTVKSNYETAEERKARQILIVRQSSLSNAIAFLKNDPAVEDVLEVAEQFVDFVFNLPVEDKSALGIESDVI